MMSPTARPMRPRVLHFITHLGLGGAESVVLTLIRQLRDEFDFAVYTACGVEDNAIGHQMRDELAGREVPVFAGTAVGIKAGGLLPAGWRALRAVQRFRPDLVHLHTEIPEAAYAVAATLRRSLLTRPVLLRTIHNSVYWHYWPRVGRWCERRMIRCHVACVSEAARQAFLRFRASAEVPSPPSEPCVIHNGVAVANVGPPKVRRRDEPARVLFAGRLERQKGADLIPEILNTTAGAAMPPSDLVIYGAGEYESVIRQCVARPPAGWNVQVVPPLPRLAERMREFDLIIIPSRFEGLSLVAIEAALAGVPIVGTCAPGLTEVLPKSHPFLAVPGDAADFGRMLTAALAHPDRAAEAARSAQEFARSHFAVETMAAAYRTWYSHALTARH